MDFHLYHFCAIHFDFKAIISCQFRHIHYPMFLILHIRVWILLGVNNSCVVSVYTWLIRSWNTWLVVKCNALKLSYQEVFYIEFGDHGEDRSTIVVHKWLLQEHDTQLLQMINMWLLIASWCTRICEIYQWISIFLKWIFAWLHTRPRQPLENLWVQDVILLRRIFYEWDNL